MELTLCLSHTEEHIRAHWPPAHHKGHSTETALLKVHTDIAEALQVGSINGLIVLNLSAAFPGITFG